MYENAKKVDFLKKGTSMYYYIVSIGTPNLTKKTKREIIRFTNIFVFGIIFENFEFVRPPVGNKGCCQ